MTDQITRKSFRKSIALLAGLLVCNTMALIALGVLGYRLTEYLKTRDRMALSPPDLSVRGLPYAMLDRDLQSNADASAKSEVPCARSRNTAVIVTLGQSNAANTALGRHVAAGRVENFDLYSGKCFKAADPLLGPTGTDGNFATRLGDMLIERGLFERVIIAPIAMGGTMVEQWAEDGLFNARIGAVLLRLADHGLAPDFILWHQGEGNAIHGFYGDPGGRQYRRNLLEVARTFRRYGAFAPFFVALVSRCKEPSGRYAAGVRAGQQGAADPTLGIYLGPDTDEFGMDLRYDGCHFNEAGVRRHAQAWADTLDRFIGQQKALPARE